MSNREGVAAEVRAAMARSKITQQELADTIGIHRVSLARRLSGAQAFNVDELYRISEALGVSMADLIPEEAA